MPYTGTITAKGQITIPLYARKALKSSTVEVVVQGEEVILRPVRSVAGALASYAVSKEPFIAIREKVWQEVSNEKTAKSS